METVSLILFLQEGLDFLLIPAEDTHDSSKIYELENPMKIVAIASCPDFPILKEIQSNPVDLMTANPVFNHGFEWKMPMEMYQMMVIKGKRLKVQFYAGNVFNDTESEILHMGDALFDLKEEMARVLFDTSLIEISNNRNISYLGNPKLKNVVNHDHMQIKSTPSIRYALLLQSDSITNASNSSLVSSPAAASQLATPKNAASTMQMNKTIASPRFRVDLSDEETIPKLAKEGYILLGHKQEANEQYYFNFFLMAGTNLQQAVSKADRGSTRQPTSFCFKFNAFDIEFLTDSFENLHDTTLNRDCLAEHFAIRIMTNGRIIEKFFMEKMMPPITIELCDGNSVLASAVLDVSNFINFSYGDLAAGKLISHDGVAVMTHSAQYSESSMNIIPNKRHSTPSNEIGYVCYRISIGKNIDDGMEVDRVFSAMALYENYKTYPGLIPNDSITMRSNATVPEDMNIDTTLTSYQNDASKTEFVQNTLRMNDEVESEDMNIASYNDDALKRSGPELDHSTLREEMDTLRVDEEIEPEDMNIASYHDDALKRSDPELDQSILREEPDPLMVIHNEENSSDFESINSSSASQPRELFTILEEPVSAGKGVCKSAKRLKSSRSPPKSILKQPAKQGEAQTDDKCLNYETKEIFQRRREKFIDLIKECNDRFEENMTMLASSITVEEFEAKLQHHRMITNELWIVFEEVSRDTEKYMKNDLNKTNLFKDVRELLKKLINARAIADKAQKQEILAFQNIIDKIEQIMIDSR